MAITQTALSADLSATGLTMTVAAGTNFPTVGATLPSQNFVCRIDKEMFLAITQPVTGVIKIAQRGYNGTAAASHDVLSKVEVGLPSDYAAPSPGNSVNLPPYLPNQQTLGESIVWTAADVAAWGNQPQNFAMTKATALAITLVAPSKAQDGLTLVFTNLTAAAHVITATSLISDGVTGGAKSTVTFAAFVGSSLTLQAENGLWNVIAAVAAPIT
jgi:hypothetical protein